MKKIRVIVGKGSNTPTYVYIDLLNDSNVLWLAERLRQLMLTKDLIPGCGMTPHIPNDGRVTLCIPPTSNPQRELDLICAECARGLQLQWNTSMMNSSTYDLSSVMPFISLAVRRDV